MEFKSKAKLDKKKRKEQSQYLLTKYPDKVPVILEKDPSSKILELKKTNFLLEKKSTVNQLLQLIRRKTELKEGEALFLQAKAKYGISGEKTIGEIYKEYKDDDGFIYIMYTTELIYGQNKIIYELYSSNYI